MEDSNKIEKTALDQWLKRKKKKSPKHLIESRPNDSQFPLSFGQKRLWLLEQVYKEQNLYNYAHKYDLDGSIDIDLLAKSFNILIDRHPILKTNFIPDGENIYQHINDRTLKIERVSPDNGNSSSSLEQLIDHLINKPFDLEKDFLFRLYFINPKPEQSLLILVMHHIVGDAWSLDIINSEVSSIYKSLITQKPDQLKPLRIKYHDFAYWQKNQQISEIAMSHWVEKLSGELPKLDLPRNNISGNSPFTGKSHIHKISEKTSETWKNLSKKLNATGFVLFLSVYKLMLHKYCQLKDIIVGTAFSNRDFSDLEHLIGFFNETLVLRSHVEPASDFVTLVKAVGETVQDAQSNKNVPFESLVNALRIEREPGTNPLFQTMFLYNGPRKSMELVDGVMLNDEMLDVGVSKFDLTIFINEQSDGLDLKIEYNAGFDEQFIQSFAHHFEHLLHLLPSKLNDPISSIPIITSDESNILLDQWNDTADSIPDVGSVHELIHNQTIKQPDHTAVVYKNESLSYSELDAWSDTIAAKLMDIDDHQFIGLYTHRSLEMIVGIMAILKSGHAYLPLDPDYPEERINYMLEDTGAQLVLTQKETTDQLKVEKSRILELSRSSFEKINNKKIEYPDLHDQYAYIIYTSGSTGRPKGVAVTHKNLIHSTSARFHFYQDEMESFLLLSSFSFDSSITGIFWSLCSGGTLVLPPKRIEQDPEELSKIIQANHVTHTLLLPSLYQVLIHYASNESLNSLKAVIVAGEACSLNLRKDHFNFLPNTRLYNEYGPTEATVWCIAHEMKMDDTDLVVPIGRPISNMSAYILDKDLHPVPVGMVGDLYIGGDGVTNGYLNQQELTQAKFIKNPFRDHGTMYKTGDIARYRQDGLLEYHGRSDTQIKIRGHRVELDEIKEWILKCEGVKDAFVKADNSNDCGPMILAYVIGDIKDKDKQVLDVLKGNIPSYMIPAHTFILAELPLLPNGKVDSNALPLPDKNLIPKDGIIPPNNETQEILLNIWSDVLKRRDIGIRDNFFEVGGDSIRSIRIIAHARRENLILKPTALFDHQTIEDLSKHVAFSDDDPFPETQIKYPITLPVNYQQKAFFFHHLQSQEDQGLLKLEFSLSGEIDHKIMKKAWEEVSSAHEVMRTTFHWDEGSEPYQHIHRDVNIDWSYTDLSGRNSSSDNDVLTIDNKKFDLANLPVHKLALIKIANATFKLHWACHHIMIDGWSAGIIFREAISIYDKLLHGSNEFLPPVRSQSEFIKWKEKQNTEEIEDFWSKHLYNAHPPLFADSTSPKKSTSTFEDKQIIISPENTKRLHEISGKSRITTATLLQGVWMLVISKYFDSEEIASGLTLSGRTSEFKGIEHMTGLFMNVLPILMKVDPDKHIGSWLVEMQSIQQQIVRSEHLDLNQIYNWANIKSNSPIFDNLFVYGNFMAESEKIGNIKIGEFKGGFSTSYPMTIRINPLRSMEFDFRYDSDLIDTESIKWITNSFQTLINTIVTSDLQGSTIENITAALPVFKPDKVRDSSQVSEESKGSFMGPQNSTQLTLIKIWEKVLGTSSIGITDDFFEIGGTSLQALALFNEIELQFDKKLPPSVLLKNSTIERISKVISKDHMDDQGWSSIVPMKTSGSEPPLFCLHSGGAHVLFYQALARQMHPEIPVYAIQPGGIIENETSHVNISEMASDYIQQIKKIQPNGPYRLLGTCFGNAVGLEMAHQLKANNENIETLYIIDSAPAYITPPSPNGERKPVSRMLGMIKKGDWNGIFKKFKNRYIRLNKKFTTQKQSQIQKDLDEIIDSLNEMYVTYQWEPIDGNILLIRSSEFEQRKNKEFHLDRWKYLSNNKLNSCVVPGHHLTLFDEPEVSGLANTLSSHLLTNTVDAEL